MQPSVFMLSIKGERGRQKGVLYAPLMLLCVVECCFVSPKHVSTINNLIETKGACGTF